VYCKRWTPNCYPIEHRYYVKLYGVIPPCCRDKLYEMLVDIKTVFNAAGIKWWMMFGTLLGAVRQQDIIPIDSDVDLGIAWEDMPKVDRVIPFLRDRYYRVQRWVKRYGKITMKYSMINKNRIDMFFYRFDNKKGVYRIFHPDMNAPFWQRTDLYEREVAQLGEATIRDHTFPTIAEPEGFLKRFYGDDWTVQLKYPSLNLPEPPYTDDTQFRYYIKRNMYRTLHWHQFFHSKGPQQEIARKKSYLYKVLETQEIQRAVANINKDA